MFNKNLTNVSRKAVKLLLCLCLAGVVAGAFAFAGAHPAHAAAADSSALQAQNDCPQGETLHRVIISTDNGSDVDCFWAPSGSSLAYASVKLYNVNALETSSYSLYFTWTDCHGATHESSKSDGSFLAAGNAAANYFGGCTSIAEITFLEVSTPVASNTTACNTSEDGSYPDTGIYVAMQASSSQPAYVQCFPDKYNATYATLQLYGVYAIWTGSNDYTVSYTWEDYNGGHHTSTMQPDTFVAPGNSPGKFAGYDSMKELTLILVNV